MRLGMPHMGNLYIPFRALFERLGIDYVIPPVTNRHTLSLYCRKVVVSSVSKSTQAPRDP